MQRRRLLKALPAAAPLGIAGCLTGGADETTTVGDGTADETTTELDGPDGIYVQTFMDEMVMAGMGTDGDLRAMLMLSIPHDFWNINGTQVEYTEREDADSFHLMTTLFDGPTKQVLPASVSTEIVTDGETVSQEVTYPMLSQRMGFHYGANFQVGEYGSYTARVTFEGMGSVRTTGEYAGTYDDARTVEIPFDWTTDVTDEFSIRDIDQGGEQGAVKPMDMDAPQGIAPDEDALPGLPIGSTLDDDVQLITRYVDTDDADGDGSAAADRIADGDPYLYVSARTRYHGFIVPMMGLEATVTRDGATVFEDSLTPTLDPTVGYHYGTRVGGTPSGTTIQSGDEVEITVTTPAQVARHEGYERAFREFDGVTYTVE